MLDSNGMEVEEVMDEEEHWGPKWGPSEPWI